MRIIFITLICLTALLATSVYAQTPAKPFNLYFSAGGTFPVKPDFFNDFHKLGYNLSGGLGFSALPRVQAIARVGLHKVLKDWNSIKYADELGNVYDDAIDGGDITGVSYGVDLQLDLGLPALPVKPYLLGGIGFMNLSEGDIKIPGANIDGLSDLEFIDSGNQFYWSLGGGVLLKSGPLFSFYLEGRYTNIKQDLVQDADLGNLIFIPINLGIKF